ncbi:MAG: sodium:calcium antiporter, partial [Promethearchaeota archaeon]
VIVLAYFVHKEPILLDDTHLHDDLWYLLLSCAFIVIASLDGKFNTWEGIVLLFIYLLYVIHQFIECRRLKSTLDEKFHETEEITIEDWIKSGGLLVAGGILLLLVAEPFVHSIEELSTELGINLLFLALVISPIASEMPEKISAFILTIKSLDGAEMAIANFVGSKVQNNTILFGLMILTASIFVGTDIPTDSDILLLLLMTLTTIVGVKVTYDMKLHPKEGIVSLILYGISIIFVLLLNTQF